MRTGGFCQTVDREISRFPRKERLHMPGSLTTPGRPGLALSRPNMLPSTICTVSAPIQCGSKCEKLRLSRTSPLIPPIADIRADIVFRCFVPQADMPEPARMTHHVARADRQ